MAGLTRQDHAPKVHSMKSPVRLYARTLFLAVSLFLLSSCSRKSDGITIIWTDQAEFASYTELFNSTQSRYRVVVEYKDNPAEALMNAKKLPDIVIGPWLKGEKTRTRLIPLDYMFTELRISSKDFYRPFLDLGSVRGRQYLLPVSFNLPALIFSSETSELPKSDFSISLDSIQELSGEFNSKKNGVYSKMGFSPRWDSEFLYIATQLFNTDFEEDTPLFSCDEVALQKAITYLKNWTDTINTSPTTEDDFQFKYLYDPPYKLVMKGKNLFSFMTSDEFLVLPQDKIQNIDFRWIEKDGQTSVKDKIIYLGVCRNAKNLEAAEAFISWFFDEKNQKAMLDRSRSMGTMDQTFGISGGFSSLTAVNEKNFPLFYPSLLGHLPPKDNLAVPKILPNNWELCKSEIVIPYLEDAVRARNGAAVKSLDSRISDWIRAH
jgi:ABC-type glycerol-3-phosphate transport system substrate-binding protein